MNEKDWICLHAVPLILVDTMRSSVALPWKTEF